MTATAQRIDRNAAAKYADVCVLLERYYDGLYRCDVATLESVFHPEAHYFTASEGAFLHLDMPAYYAIVRKRHSPESRGEPYGYEVDAIDFADSTTASVRMRATLLSKNYIDFLSLLRVEGEWRIVAKVFHATPKD